MSQSQKEYVNNLPNYASHFVIEIVNKYSTEQK